MNNFKDFNSLIQSLCDIRNQALQDYDRKLLADSRISVEKYTQLYTNLAEQIGDQLHKRASLSPFYSNIHLVGCIHYACYSGENRTEFYKKHFTS